MPNNTEAARVLGAARIAGAAQTLMTKHLSGTRVLIAACSAFLAGTPALAQGSYPIHGIHFWKAGAQSAIMNGKSGWAVEMYYTRDTRLYSDSQWQSERENLRRERDEGFRVILGVDKDREDPIPQNRDWEGRSEFARDCAKIAEQVGDLVERMVFGNELRTVPEWAKHPKEWYATVFTARANG